MPSRPASPPPTPSDPDSAQQASRRKRVIQFTLLGLLLIVAPVGSYLYLKAGYDYRLASLNEFGELGAFGDLVTDAGQVADGEVRLLYTVPPSADDSVAQSIRLLHDAFSQQDFVEFVGLRGASSGGDILAAQPQSLVLPQGAYRAAALANAGARDPFCESVPVAQRALVVDTAGTVRRCYDLHLGRDVNRIVEQLNILVPRPAEEDIFVEREREY